MNRRRSLFNGLIFLVLLNLLKSGASPALAASAGNIVSTITLSPSAPGGGNGWYTTPLGAVIAASDLVSGVKTINWKLDSGPLNTTTFANTLNLILNPSFESSSPPPIASWTYAGPGSSTASRDTANFKFGSAAAKIVSVENGWGGFNNQSSYVPVQPFSNMTVSVWLKTQNVQGNGAYLRIYDLSSSGANLIAQSTKITGTNDWLRISQSFTNSVSNAYGVYLDLGLEGTGTVWYDGVTLNSSTTDTLVGQTFSGNGRHTLEYYSVNNNDETEDPHNLISFKIDTASPGNWRNFKVSQEGNDHSLQSQITVDDGGSGIDPTVSNFQYSVDGGNTWGYYSDLTACNSSWINNGWRSLTTNLQNNGSTATLLTPTVDYCNSNWETCKTIRFKTADLAGNQAVNDVCLYDSWFQVTGDVAARSSISYFNGGSTFNTDGVVISGSTISNFSSSNNWYLTNYAQSPLPSYAELKSRYNPTAPLPSGQLPTQSGLYLANSGFTVSKQTVPASFSTVPFNAVVFVGGDLTINSSYSLSPDSSLVFFVLGNVQIDKGVTSLEGFFLSDGNLDTTYNGQAGTQLTLKGSFLADTLSLKRNLKNNQGPSFLGSFNPSYFTKLADYLGTSQISWRNVN